MNFDLSQLSVIAFVIASVLATALYARRRMDIRVTNLYLDLKGKLDETERRLELSRQELEIGRQELKSLEQSSAAEAERVSGHSDEFVSTKATLEELTSSIRQLEVSEGQQAEILAANGDFLFQKGGLQQMAEAIDSLQAKVDDLATGTSERQQALNAKLDEQSLTIEELEQISSDTNRRILLISKQVSEFDLDPQSGLPVRYQHALKEVTEEVSEIRSCLHSVSKDLEMQLSVDRVADVEQLAMIAAHMAGDSLARLGATAPQTVSSSVHGHALLMYQILLDRSNRTTVMPANGIHVLEIGTTREKWWPQMSTSRLAALCRSLGLKMLTVDVDELSSAVGQESKRFYGDAIEVKTEAGEETAENWVGELPPYIYVDAYDFEHDSHSDERQERYRTLQGQEINNEACWKMHLRCAQAFVQKCPKGGVVVFDDVFLKDDAWSGKGKLAVPYMLEEAFDLIVRTSTTAVFRRKLVDA